MKKGNEKVCYLMRGVSCNSDVLIQNEFQILSPWIAKQSIAKKRQVHLTNIINYRDFLTQDNYERSKMLSNLRYYIYENKINSVLIKSLADLSKDHLTVLRFLDELKMNNIKVYTLESRFKKTNDEIKRFIEKFYLWKESKD